MRTKGMIFVVIAAMAVGVGNGSGATNEVSGLLQKGLFEEEANRDLDAAIRAYEAVIAQTDKDRGFAATAVFRLGECYRKQGKTNEADVQYERILREFPDRTELAKLSRQYIGNAQVAPATNATFAERLTILKQATKDEQENAEIERLKALLKDSPDRINAQDQNGQMPLFHAVSHDQFGVAKFLLDQHANTEVRDNFFRTPLIESADRGNKEMVELLLQHGADANAAMTGQQRGSPYEGKTALHYAVEKGYKGVAEALLAHGADVDVKNAEGKTPLHLATEKGYKSVAELLLAHGANIEARRETGATPLLEAASAGNKAIAELLLANHADVNATDNDGATALYKTADVGNASIADLLLANHADINLATKIGTTPLMEAISQSRQEVAELLLKRGADVKAQQKKDRTANGWTALNFAVEKDNPEMVKELIEKGADVDAVAYVYAPPDLVNTSTASLHDFTPLMQAIYGGKSEVVKVLLAHKADVNFRSTGGESPLLVAVKKASIDMVKLLLDHEADVKVLDKDGWSVLQHAVADRHPEIVQLLLEHGADAKRPYPAAPLNSMVNNSDWKGVTPLGYAVATGGVDAAKLLLARGADVDAHTATDWTPLHMAAFYRASKEMFELLLAHNPNVNAVDNRGYTPLDISLDVYSKNTNEITEMLRAHGAIRGLERGTIRIQRGDQTGTVFWRDASGYNHHTLYEVLGYVYPRPLGLSYPSQLTPGHFRQPELPGFYFPDFAHIRIQHVENKAVSGLHTNIVTFDSLASALNDGDCSPNMELNWGDVVELPELDHNVSDNWLGLSDREKETLKKCLERHVKIIVKGKETKLTLAPYLAMNGAAAGEASSTTELPVFWLSDVVRGAKVILASSDVTRIKVKRKHPVSGKPEEMVFDLNKIDTHSDLWLEDGDVIEIPEKKE